MNRNEEIGLLFIRDSGSRFERNEIVIVTRHHNFSAKLRFNQLLYALGDVEDQLLFGVTMLADRAGIVTSMSGVDNNSRELETKAADERPSPGIGCLGRSNRLRLRFRRFLCGAGCRSCRGRWGYQQPRSF